MKKMNQIYFVLFVKIISSFAFVYMPTINSLINGMLFLPFSNISIYFLAAMSYDPNLTMISIVLSLAVTLILLIALICMLVGITFDGAKKASYWLITFTVIIDLLFSFFVHEIIAKTSCVIVSIIMTIMCVRTLRKM